MTASVYATPQLEPEVEYNGTDGGSQAMNVTLVVTSDTIASNIDITLTETDDAVIDYDSLDEAVPGDVSIEESARGYTIEELEPGQVVEIKFTAYPRTVSQEELDVARIVLNSDEQPSADIQRIRTDITGTSPWFELQRANEELATLEEEKNEELATLEEEKNEELATLEEEKDEELAALEEEKDSEIESLEQNIQGMRAIMFGGAALGIIGIVSSVYLYRNRDQKSDELRKNIEIEITSLRDTLLSTLDEETDSGTISDFYQWADRLENKYDISSPNRGSFTTDTPDGSGSENGGGGWSKPDDDASSGGSEWSESGDTTDSGGSEWSDSGDDTDDSSGGFGGAGDDDSWPDSSDDDGF